MVKKEWKKQEGNIALRNRLIVHFQDYTLKELHRMETQCTILKSAISMVLQEKHIEEIEKMQQESLERGRLQKIQEEFFKAQYINR